MACAMQSRGAAANCANAEPMARQMSSSSWSGTVPRTS